MTNLPALGIASYNGVTFTALCETLNYTVTPVEDVSGRTFSYYIHRIRLRDEVTVAFGTVDSTMDALTTALMQPAAPLQFLNKGTGTTMAVNINTVPRDVVWGPKPREIAFEILGGNRTLRVTWTVEIALPNCPFGARTIFALMEFNWRLTIETDKSGYSKRTYTGYLRIPQTRINTVAHVLSDCADNYWEAAIPPAIEGFRRGTMSRTLDESKCRLDFSVTDEEMPPNIPPPGIIEAQASHELYTQGDNVFQWRGIINASYEVDRHFNKGIAYVAFWKLVQDRLSAGDPKLKKFFEGGDKVLGSGVGNRNDAVTVIPTGMRLREPEIYGRKTAEFALYYRFATSLENILTRGGLWRPVPGSDWGAWAASLSNSAFAARGNAFLRILPRDDLIVDLCGPQPRPPVQQPSQTVVRGNPGPPNQTIARAADPPKLKLQEVEPHMSWLDYKIHLEIRETNGAVQHVPLPKAPVQQQGASGQGQGQATATEGQKFPTSPVDAKIQLRAPSYVAILSGYAIRAAFPIQRPEIKSICGQPAVLGSHPRAQYFKHSLLSRWWVPVYYAEFRLMYFVKNVSPVSMDIPYDPSKDPFADINPNPP